MNSPTPNEIRAATHNVLRIIDESFGKESSYYLLLSDISFKPRVSLEKNITNVRILRAWFRARDLHRSVSVCDEYLKLNNDDEKTG